MTAAPLDPEVIRRQHQHFIDGGTPDDWCWTCEAPWPCDPYRLSDDLAAAQNSVIRLSENLADARIDRDKARNDLAAAQETLAKYKHLADHWSREYRALLEAPAALTGEGVDGFCVCDPFPARDCGIRAHRALAGEGA